MKNKINIVITLLVLTQSIAFAMPFKGEGLRKKNAFLFTVETNDNDETKYNTKGMVPLAKFDRKVLLLEIENKQQNIPDEKLKERLGDNRFHSTSLTISMVKKKSESGNPPLMISIGVQKNGHELMEGSSTTGIARLVTGQKTKNGTHMYGLMYGYNGIFSGIPFPFYSYKTIYKSHQLTVGFPFVSIKSPKLYKSLFYSANVSPRGAKLEIGNKMDEDYKLSGYAAYEGENLVLDTENYKNESLGLLKTSVGLKLQQKITKKIHFDYQINRIFDRKYFLRKEKK